VRVVLTGATGGIGRTIADVLKKSDIELLELNKLTCDLSTGGIDFSFEDFEPVDGLIHCAGINIVKDYKNINKEEFYRLFNINAFSFVSLCQKINFSSGSNIIAIGSLWATGTKNGRIQYSMSKHALLAAVKTLALEMSEHQVKVNMVSPGFVNTHMTQQYNSADHIRKLDEYIPLGLTQPAEIGTLCLYLLKNNVSITGQNLIIDGGYSCKNI